METARINLLTFARFAIRDVLWFAKGQNRLIIDENVAEHSSIFCLVSRLLIILEHCLCHGLRQKLPHMNGGSLPEIGSDMLRTTTSMLLRAKEQLLPTSTQSRTTSNELNPWPVILHLEEYVANGLACKNTIQAMSEVRTGLGRSRIWIRQTLMRKNLSVYFQHLIQSDGCCLHPDNQVAGPTAPKKSEDPPSHSLFYHPEAFLLNDEGVEFNNLLSGLCSVDFCFVLRENLQHFDTPLSVIPYHIYSQNYKEKSETTPLPDSSHNRVDTDSILDQNMYLEDLNSKLQNSLKSKEKAHQQQSKLIAQLNATLNHLQLENRSMKITISHLKSQHVAVNEVTVSQAIQCNMSSTDFTMQVNFNDEECGRLNAEVEEKTVLVQSLRDQLLEIQSHKILINRQLENTKVSVEQKQMLIRQLEDKLKTMNSVTSQLRERSNIMEAEKASTERVINQLRMEVCELQSELGARQAEVINLQSERSSLVSDLSSRTSELELLRPITVELETCKSTLHQLRQEVEHWRSISEAQEASLTEMAAMVGSSKLEANELRESHTALKQAQWTTDALAPNCFQCNVAFSISRRRHHCRNCGRIFCYSCSSHSMALPSSPKPVRVCDTCHDLLLHRYTTKS